MVYGHVYRFLLDKDLPLLAVLSYIWGTHAHTIKNVASSNSCGLIEHCMQSFVCIRCQSRNPVSSHVACMAAMRSRRAISKHWSALLVISRSGFSAEQIRGSHSYAHSKPPKIRLLPDYFSLNGHFELRIFCYCLIIKNVYTYLLQLSTLTRLLDERNEYRIKGMPMFVWIFFNIQIIVSHHFVTNWFGPRRVIVVLLNSQTTTDYKRLKRD